MTSALLRLRRPAATLLLLPAVALGCAGGQTGEETTLACRDTRTTLRADEESPLGFGAAEVLAAASATSAPLVWFETNPHPLPESGAAELTVSLEPRGTAAFVKSRAPDGDESPQCLDHVAVDVRATVATSGGALAETFDGRLLATDPDVATLSHTFKDGNVDGTLSFDAASLAGRRVVHVTFVAIFGDGALSGTLSAGIEQVSGETASFQEPTIACFGGAAGNCPPP